jgi:hypothetical protein
MRTFLVAMVGGLAVLVGFAGAANALENIELRWQTTGTNTISSVATTAFITLDVVIVVDVDGEGGTEDGTSGGDISIDYNGDGSNKLVLDSFNDNNATFNFELNPAVDAGGVLLHFGRLNTNFPRPCSDPCEEVVLGTITFHKEATLNNATIRSLYADATDGINNNPLTTPPGPPVFGTAMVVNAPEPGALSLLALGFGGLIVGRNRKS